MKRLEASHPIIRERALAYFTSHIRRWKRALPRMASEALRVRTLFRVAHFNEFRGKAAKAAKYYSLVGSSWGQQGVVHTWHIPLLHFPRRTPSSPRGSRAGWVCTAFPAACSAPRVHRLACAQPGNAGEVRALGDIINFKVRMADVTPHTA